MPLMLSNLTVSTKAPAGTIIGSLSLVDSTGVSRVANFTSTENAAGYFGILGSNLVTLRASISPGNYCFQIYGNGQYVPLSGEGSFVITVTAT
jgi:hypothetical protein